ncbi:MAG: polysaccharide deacetylase family protein [Candidatus Contendobacter sp.]|nr:polysaccharide deacetylase family protein [Candidatus Contendobacter sp.]MDG4556546.1 polysaccharide deacetylase family protein [Candidatus Contendobacter sp.]
MWVLVALGSILALAEPDWRQACALIGVGGCYIVLLAAGSLTPRLDFYLRAARRGSASRPWVALTFDDGPDPVTTPLLLELLRRERISAAFFFVGEAARHYPDLVARTAADGHLIGNHSDRHGYGWTVSSTERLFAEFAAANRTLADILGYPPRFARMPAGISRPRLDDVLRRLQLRNVAWDVRGLEGFYRDPERIAARVARRARNGSIILLHELYYGTSCFKPRQALATAQATIDQLRARGFHFVRLDRLLEQADPTVVSSDQKSPLEAGVLLLENGVDKAMGYRGAAPVAPRARRAA